MQLVCALLISMAQRVSPKRGWVVEALVGRHASGVKLAGCRRLATGLGAEVFEVVVGVMNRIRRAPPGEALQLEVAARLEGLDRL